MFLRGKLLQAYRDSFENYELSKLSELERKGYNWYWDISLTESSGIMTKTERDRISKKYGSDGLEQWANGLKMAGALYKKAIKAYEEARTEAHNLCK